MPGELDTKVCPFCAETIKLAAIKCRFCSEILNGAAVAELTNRSRDATPDFGQQKELREAIQSEPVEEKTVAAPAGEDQIDIEPEKSAGLPAPDETLDSAEWPAQNEAVLSKHSEVLAYPATFDVQPPLEFGGWRVLARIFVIFVLTILQFGFLGTNTIYILAGAYIIPPVLAAIFVSQKGAEKYLAEAEASQAKWLRYFMGFLSFMLLATDTLPFRSPPENVVKFNIQPTGSPTTGSSLKRIILAIPHAIILSLLAIVFAIVWLVAATSILLRDGTYPQWASSFIRGYLRWIARVLVYMASLVDEYPPFSLEYEPPKVRSLAPAGSAAETPVASSLSHQIDFVADIAEGKTSDEVLVFVNAQGRRLALSEDGFAVDSTTFLEYLNMVPSVLELIVGIVPVYGRLLSVPFKLSSGFIRRKAGEARVRSLSASGLTVTSVLRADRRNYFVNWDAVTSTKVELKEASPRGKGLHLIFESDGHAGKSRERRTHRFTQIEGPGVSETLRILQNKISGRMDWEPDVSALELQFISAEVARDHFLALGFDAEVQDNDERRIHFATGTYVEVKLGDGFFEISLRHALAPFQETSVKWRRSGRLEWKGDVSLVDQLRDDPLVWEPLVELRGAKDLEGVVLDQDTAGTTTMFVGTAHLPTPALMGAIARIAEHLHDLLPSDDREPAAEATSTPEQK